LVKSVGIDYKYSSYTIKTAYVVNIIIIHQIIGGQPQITACS